MHVDDDKPVDIDFLVKQDFQPAPAEVLERMKHLANIDGINNPYLVVLRLAIVTMEKSKPELISIAQELWDQPTEGSTAIGDHPANAFTNMLEGTHATAECFRWIAKFLDSAEARMICVAAHIEDGTA